MPSTGTTSLVDNAGMDKKERKNLDSKKSVDKNSPDKKSDKKRKCCKRKKKSNYIYIAFKYKCVK